jgi:glutathione reductase (NADPH)
VVGGGSGGLACAKRAASYGASVAVIEGHRYGGTCVNVGCVPKKVMFNASHMMEIIHDAKEFGITVGEVSFDWGKLKRYRDRYISRLNTIYEGGLDKMNITRISGFATFIDDHNLRIGDSHIVQGDKILIAVGGSPAKLPIPGSEYAIDSDGFFELESQPRKVAIIGGGYIAVELGGVFNGLGTETHLYAREASILRTFDPMIQTQLIKVMNKNGPHLFLQHVPEKIEKEEDGKYKLYCANGKVGKVIMIYCDLLIYDQSILIDKTVGRRI